MTTYCRSLFCCFLALVTTTSLTSLGFAESWPQYRGQAGDGKSLEKIGDVKWPANGPSVEWKSPTPLGFSSFSIADGRAFTLIAVDSFEYCLALDAETGDELWRVKLETSDYKNGGGNAGAPGNKGGDGPRSTPATDGTHVYVYDSHMVLRCLTAKDGSEVWSHDIQEEFAGRNIKWLNATSPVLDGNALYIAGGGAGQSFLAFHKKNGELIWKSGDDTMTHATPALTTVDGKKQLIYFMQSGLVGVSAANGEVQWKTKFPFSVSTAASPIIEGDRVYCSAGYGVGAGLFKINGSPEAEELWFKSNSLMNHWSTPVVHDGHIYGIFEFKKYGKAPLQCVELATGKIKWSERGFGPGNCIMVDDKLVVLSDAGEVAIVDVTPAKYSEVARAKILQGKCWSTPAYSDGRIYVRSTEQGACIKVK